MTIFQAIIFGIIATIVILIILKIADKLFISPDLESMNREMEDMEKASFHPSQYDRYGNRRDYNLD